MRVSPFLAARKKQIDSAAGRTDRHRFGAAFVRQKALKSCRAEIGGK